jgi:CubicO group peptidase (beta-lactamase class C family)
MLQEEGKLSLEDKVGQYLLELDSASRVTLRQLLSHTAGIRDFWPQDYVFTRMLSPISHACRCQIAYRAAVSLAG